MKAPKECPMCGEKEKWKYIDDAKKVFLVEKPLLVELYLDQQVQLLEHQERKNIYIFVQVVVFNTNMINKQF